MKKRITLTIDEDVYEGLKELPRKVSISEVVSWVLRAMVEDVKPNGMTEEEFIEYMENHPRGREVRRYLQEKLAPFFAGYEKVKRGINRGVKGEPKKGVA